MTSTRSDRSPLAAEPTIERCTDGSAIARLMRAALPDGWSDAALRSELDRRDSLAWLARDRAGLHMGFLILRLGVDCAEILLVGVPAECRRRGVAGALVRCAVAAAAERGCPSVQLELRASNAAARRLYESADFVVVGRRSRYYRGGEDALLMTRSPA